MHDSELSDYATRLVVRFVEAVNLGDRETIRTLSVLGIEADSVVSRYCDILEQARPLKVLSISSCGPVARNRSGPRWARWVGHDQVRLFVRIDSARGVVESEILVWLYDLESGLAGEPASRLVA